MLILNVYLINKVMNYKVTIQIIVGKVVEIVKILIYVLNVTMGGFYIIHQIIQLNVYNGILLK